MLGSEIALFDRIDLVLGLAQIEKELLLVRRRPELHQAPRPEDVFLYGGANPPHGIGGETKTLVRFKSFDRLHEADIALCHDFGDRQAIAAITHRNLGD